MHTSISLRPIRPQEASEAKRLIFQIAHEVMEPETPFEQFRAQWDAWGVFDDLHDIQKHYLDNGGAFWVAEDAGQIVGTGAFWRYTLEGYEGYCELKRIALHPDYRGYGLGHALITTLIREAAALDYRKMILWTNRHKLARAVELYLRIGFVEVQHPQADPDDIWLALGLAD